MKDNVPVLTQCQEKDAPWNQEDPAPVQIDCTVCYCMSRSMPVKVEHYSMEEGEPVFTDTNFIQEFVQDPCAFGIPTLLKVLVSLAKERIEKLKDIKTLKYVSKGFNERDVDSFIKFYQNVIKATEGWIVDDLDVCKDD